MREKTPAERPRRLDSERSSEWEEGLFLRNERTMNQV